MRLIVQQHQGIVLFIKEVKSCVCSEQSPYVWQMLTEQNAWK